jgi:hypothetical protein
MMLSALNFTAADNCGSLRKNGCRRAGGSYRRRSQFPYRATTAAEAVFDWLSMMEMQTNDCGSMAHSKANMDKFDPLDQSQIPPPTLE